MAILGVVQEDMKPAINSMAATDNSIELLRDFRIFIELMLVFINVCKCKVDFVQSKKEIQTKLYHNTSI